MSHTLVTLIHAQEEVAATAPVKPQEAPACRPVALAMAERTGAVLGFSIRPEAAVLLAVVVGLFLALLMTVNNLKMRVTMLERLVG